jgi:integrase
MRLRRRISAGDVSSLSMVGCASQIDGAGQNRAVKLAGRRVFPGANRQKLGNAMRNVCRAVGLADYSPHDLRQRYISLKIREGVPMTEVAAQVGHARQSVTLDTYSHVLLDP